MQTAASQTPFGEAEQKEKDEDLLITRIESTLRRRMERDYAAKETRRDAHPKHHGLLQAEFQVLPDLPAELRVGVFAQPRTFRAWLRSSSASGVVQSDAKKDVRGMAIKLLDVGGEKIPESDEPSSQDFVMVSIPTMPLGTVRLFHDAIYYSIEWSPFLFAAKMVLTGQARVVKQLDAAKMNHPSPLDIRYWSTTPYQLGPDQAVKFSFIPVAPAASEPPAPLTDTYLTDVMERRLATQPVHYDFALQLRKEGMPLHDAAVAWDEAVSPFVKVARVTIPAQKFWTVERNQLAEALSFSPAHARVEHRPLGSVNRARMRIYKALSEFRHQRAGIPRAPQATGATS
jgi:hypothetical protein